MLNIISRSIYQKHPSGPKKLIDNLLKGFDQLGVPYALNKNPLDCQHTWIHDDPDAIVYICKNKVPEGSELIFGPNIFFQPEQIYSKVGDIESGGGNKNGSVRGNGGNFDIGNSNLLKGKYIMPADWVANYWRKHGYTAPSVIWPVGIDTEYFSPSIHRVVSDELGKSDQSDTILLYTKGRAQEDIQIIIDFLNSKQIKFLHIVYGKHSEPELMSAGANCKFGIIIDSSESQGIAIQELMSLNLPLVIFDIEYLNQKSYTESKQDNSNRDSSGDRDRATSVPYFDSRCGIIAKSPEEVKAAISEMLSSTKDNLNSKYSPRKFIEENLSLKKQALEFLKNIEYPLQNSGQALPDKNINSVRNWKNRTWYKPFLLAKFFFKYLKFKL